MPATKSRPPKKRPVGRPPSGKPTRSERIMISATPEQRTRWQAQADAAHRDLGEWLWMELVRLTE
jgi:hypothetical protein